MCFHCWTDQEGNVIYSENGKDVLAIYIPEGKYRVPGMKIYVCCVCNTFCRQPSWFVKRPEDSPFCEHDEDGTVMTVEALCRNRGIGALHAPATLRELLES